MYSDFDRNTYTHARVRAVANGVEYTTFSCNWRRERSCERRITVPFAGATFPIRRKIIIIFGLELALASNTVCKNGIPHRTEYINTSVLCQQPHFPLYCVRRCWGTRAFLYYIYQIYRFALDSGYIIYAYTACAETEIGLSEAWEPIGVVGLKNGQSKEGSRATEAWLQLRSLAIVPNFSLWSLYTRNHGEPEIHSNTKYRLHTVETKSVSCNVQIHRKFVMFRSAAFWIPSLFSATTECRVRRRFPYVCASHRRKERMS